MDSDLIKKSDYVISILDNNNIPFEVYEHEPVYSYEDAEKIKNEFGFCGTESKSLFLKGKLGYYIYLTIQGVNADFKYVKSLVADKVSVCPSSEMTKVIKCCPGCVSPFGHDEEISLIIDPIIFNQENIIFSPGVPNKTIVIKGNDLKKIINNISNRKYFVER